MSGLCLDHSLLYQARKFITAANVHCVKTWIFCYETSAPHSEHRQRYEKLLREFVALKTALLGARAYAELARRRSNRAYAKAESLDREIESLWAVA